MDLIRPLLEGEAGLWSLLAASFLSATLLPGGSEAVLAGVLLQDPGALWPALAVATLGNTAGGMTSYALGRLAPQAKHRREIDWLHRHGSPALVLAWAPIVGDALCVAAGWLRVNPWASAGWMAAGKFARYWAVAQAII